MYRVIFEAVWSRVLVAGVFVGRYGVQVWGCTPVFVRLCFTGLCWRTYGYGLVSFVPDVP